MTKAAMNVLNNILDMLSDYLVVGQDAQVLTSESMSALVMKIDVKDLAGANVSIAGGSFVLPAEVKDMFASLEDPNCYITAKVQDKNNVEIFQFLHSGRIKHTGKLQPFNLELHIFFFHWVSPIFF